MAAGTKINPVFPRFGYLNLPMPSRTMLPQGYNGVFKNLYFMMLRRVFDNFI